MSETERRALTGSCVCGASSFEAAAVSTSLGACHCGLCRRWGGGPLLAVECGTDVKFAESSQVSVFPSSEWAERGFCARCGTHLFYRLKESGEYHVPVGLFKDDGAFQFDHQVFIDEKPEYYSFNGETRNMTGAELFAMFGAS